MKKILILILSVAVFVGSVSRIIYVNTIEFPCNHKYTYNMGETFNSEGLEIEVLSKDICSLNDMKEQYTELPEECLDDYDMVVEISIKNITSDEGSFDVTKLTLSKGIDTGGGTNPYIYQYLNSDVGMNITVNKNETKKVKVAYPLEKDDIEQEQEFKLVFSLYPEKKVVKL